MTKVYIGIDAHKESNALALAWAGRDVPVFYGKVSADLNRTVDTLRKIRKEHALEKDEIELCYEAGPTGFVLARRLIKLGYHCIVVAPSKIPVKSGDKVKTDRRDARKLARPRRRGSQSALRATRFAIRLQLICFREVPISAPCRSCSAMRMFRPP